MSGLFFGLEVGKRALLAQQLAMNTSGHNIANASTPGYSRQRVSLNATNPIVYAYGAMGTGVIVDNVTHVRDLFLGNQWRQDNSQLSYWSTANKSLSQIENYFNEPGDTGLNQLITDFWNSWENLSTNPSARTAVVEKANVMVNAFHEHAAQLEDMRTNLDDDIRNRVEQINLLAEQIAGLNKEIARTELTGTMANDMRDRRDLLVDQLSNYADVKIYQRNNGAVAVHLGSMALVDGASHMSLATKTVSDGSRTITKTIWQGTDFEVKFEGGELYALQQLRDKVVPQFQKDLDQLAATIATQVNAIHVAGYDEYANPGVNFFDPNGTTASSMAINPDLIDDAGLVAASLSGEPGDTRNAQAISELRYARVMSSGSLTINEFYAGFVANVGIRSKESEDLAANYTLLTTQLENAKQSIQGVSIDEEMTNMIKNQRAYEAAARVITFVDSALETVISGMGITR